MLQPSPWENVGRSAFWPLLLSRALSLPLKSFSFLPWDEPAGFSSSLTGLQALPSLKSDIDYSERSIAWLQGHLELIQISRGVSNVNWARWAPRPSSEWWCLRKRRVGRLKCHSPFFICSVAFSCHQTLIESQRIWTYISALWTEVLDIERDERFQGCLVLLTQM